MSTKRDLAALLRKYKDEQGKVRNEVSQIVKANAFAGNRIAKRKAPKAFGKLSQSIGVDIKMGGLEAEVVANADYAPYVEFGTGGKVDVPQEWIKLAQSLRNQSSAGGFEDALQRVKDWCRLKGIDEKAAYPILITLIENGQRPQPFMYPAWQETKKQFTKDMKQYVKSR